MKISEIVEELSKFPDDMEVLSYCRDLVTYLPAKIVEQIPERSVGNPSPFIMIEGDEAAAYRLPNPDDYKLYYPVDDGVTRPELERLYSEYRDKVHELHAVAREIMAAKDAMGMVE